jgi:hypothetical protein
VADSVTISLSAWERRVLRRYASRHWVPKDGHSWQDVAESLLIDAIADAAGEMDANRESVPNRPGRAGRRAAAGDSIG